MWLDEVQFAKEACESPANRASVLSVSMAAPIKILFESITATHRHTSGRIGPHVASKNPPVIQVGP